MTGHRMSQVDNLRTLMVAWVIGAHALMGYTAVGGWAYDEVNETTFSAPMELVLTVVVGPSGLFVIGAFFFVSGLFTPVSVERTGRRAFAVDRLVRLGLPWAVSALLVWPLSVWLAYRAAGHNVTPWGLIFQRSPVFDSGALWFALILLIYSVGYVLVPVRFGGVGGHQLVVAAAAIAVGSFVVRLVFPARSAQPGDLHLWQWPQCLGMFLLGIAAARSGWARGLPERVYRVSGVVAGVTLVLVPVVALALGVTQVASGVDEFLGGWHWQAAATAVVEGVLVVFGSVWLLGFAQRRFTWSGSLASVCSRAAFPAFVLQGPVLLLLATALRPVALPADVKGPLLVLVALPASFWLGSLLVARARPAPVARPAES